jgi:mannose-6-phosphate isomerase-like protein (cupin superfamily)
MKYKNKYLFKLEDGREEPIKDLERALRIVIIDKERVGAEDITFAYCRFDGKMSLHKKHIHQDAEEIMYILSGQGIGGVKDQQFEMKKGDTAWVPRGSVHWFYNPFEEPCEMLFVYTRSALQSAGYDIVE